ncbi:MAG: hypothetical protein IKM04_06830 [Clostridia bacterium]|nr:hypothetical protein [Clostridia bacterium]
MKDVRRYLNAVKVIERFAESSGMYDKEILPEEFGWITDNAYLVGEEKDIIRGEVQGRKGLPISAVSGRIPCIYMLADGFLRAGAADISEDRLRTYLSGVQQERVLNENELWIFCGMLRCAVINRLSELAEDAVREVREYGDKNSVFYAERKAYDILCAQKELPYELKHRAGKAMEAHAKLSKSIKNVFGALRTLRRTDYSKVLSDMSELDRILRTDPAASYAASDKSTRAAYRTKTERIAKRSGRSETETAKALIYSSRIESDPIKQSVCWQIDNDPYIIGPQKRRAVLVLAADMILPVIISATFSIAVKSIMVFFVALLPLWEFTKSILHHVILSHISGYPVPRLDLSAGIPCEGNTIVAVSELICSKEQADEAVAALERHYLSNRECGDSVLYGILADFKDSRSQRNADDEDIVSTLKQSCNRLNDKYGSRFCFFIRERTYYKRENIYFGKERKRGALAALAALICNEESELCIYGTSRERLQNVKYILALDADTVPTPDSIRYMIGCALHPVNKAVVDEDKGCVVSGYGIFQMRISTDLEAACASEFARIYAGQGGTDSYSGHCADMYQDVFGEAIFNGKGLIDVRAMHSCLKDAIPDERILSHDLLEGSYLRTAFVSRAEMTDGFPAKVLSFFKRYSRWVRGDVQLIPWLCKKVKNKKGNTVENPINGLSRYKIFDNIRRILTPVVQLIALSLFFVRQNPMTAAVAISAFLSLAVPLFINCAVRIKSIGQSLSTKGHATVYSGIGGGLILTVSKILFLPYEAYVSARSLVTSLYRMYFSKKKLLEWVTAAESEKTSVNGVGAYYSKMMVCPIHGAAMLLAGMNPLAFIVAAFWLFSPLFAAGISVKTDYAETLTDKDRKHLRKCAQNMWRYFEDNCTEDNNFLPPDNYQEHPLKVCAELTSPTNIGFALLSAVAVDLLKLANGINIIRNIIKNLSVIEKKDGMLYNWYNIKNLEPLYPYYVSSVDCGNLAGALIITSEYLSKSYPRECKETIEEIQKLYSEMDFGMLYDKKRKLFFITDAEDSGHYDMLASEARLLSYIAIAKRDVPVKHWSVLSRRMSKKNGYSGLVSWGGSLFEFLMPDIYMPSYRNSLLCESGKFAVHCQRLRSLPWGISESGYYSFDRELKYQYKGHGVAAAGVKNGLEKELVISPYSTFLALSSEPRKAMANLYMLDKCFPKGRYGLYEAYDLTAVRLPEGEAYMPVRSFMAHHLGMSLCSVANRLTADGSGLGILQRLFYSKTEMAAYKSLLTERIPLQQRIVKNEKKIKTHERSHIRYSISLDESREVHFANLSANKMYSLTSGKNGYNESLYGNISLYRAETDCFENLPGVLLLLKDEEGVFSTCSSMAYAEMPETEFTERYTKYTARRRNCVLQYFIAAAQTDSAELRELVVLNNGKTDEKFTVCIYFEPMLTEKRTFESHPDYNRMLIYTERIENGACVLRRSKDGESKNVLCFVTDADKPRITTSRDVLGRINYDLPEKMFLSEDSESFGEVRDSCVRCIFDITIEAGSKKRVRFSIAAGQNKEQASLAAERTLLINSGKTGRLLTDTAGQMGLDVTAVRAVLAVLPYVIYPSAVRSERFAPSKELLWSVRISGDHPLIVARADKGIENVFKAVAIFRMLRSCGRKIEMIILTNDGGRYERRQYAECQAALHFAGKHFLSEIVLADCSEIGQNVLDAIYSAAAFVIPFKDTDVYAPQKRTDRYGGRPSCLPKLMHSQPLANERFGVMSADCGLMHLWSENSRLNRFTPWENDPLAGYTKGINVVYSNGERNVSLFAADDGYKTEVCFDPGVTVWKKKINDRLFITKAYVDSQKAILNVEINASEVSDGEVRIFIKPIIGEYQRENKNVTIRIENGTLYATNPSNTAFSTNTLALSARPGISKYTGSTKAYYEGRFDSSVKPSPEPCLAAAVPMTKEGVLICVRAGKGDDLPTDERAVPCTEFDSLKIKTPWPELDSYINEFSARQIKVSRLYARTSVYQNGGAYGFRDQLQDTASLLLTEPELLRRQIIKAASHQYLQGDVQHWWHPELKTSDERSLGVRTRCSDDLLWLVWGVCEYIRATGDRSILSQTAPFLDSEPLQKLGKERYEEAMVTRETASIEVHCKKALELFMQRGLGSHGLPLILGGDWNDGMNRLGEKGMGESVWLAHFAGRIFRSFGALIGNEEYISYADLLRKGALSAYSNGQYIRGYDDMGNAVGQEGDAECSIDSISQSFAVFDNGATQDNIAAVEKAMRLLVDRENKVVKLFTPPFLPSSGSRVGYISAYPPGVRENGGQYTHAAVWLASAGFKCGLCDEALEIMRMLLPSNHDPDVYRGEPFVIAADVYGEGMITGRCGWSWYTGAAGWYRRTVLEDMLGISFENGEIKVTPAIDDDFECEFERSGKKYRIVQKSKKTTLQIT